MKFMMIVATVAANHCLPPQPAADKIKNAAWFSEADS
jgi:hypothetical protein